MRSPTHDTILHPNTCSPFKEQIYVPRPKKKKSDTYMHIPNDGFAVSWWPKITNSSFSAASSINLQNLFALKKKQYSLYFHSFMSSTITQFGDCSGVVKTNVVAFHSHVHANWNTKRRPWNETMQHGYYMQNLRIFLQTSTNEPFQICHCFFLISLPLVTSAIPYGVMKKSSSKS